MKNRLAFLSSALLSIVLTSELSESAQAQGLQIGSFNFQRETIIRTEVENNRVQVITPTQINTRAYQPITIYDTAGNPHLAYQEVILPTTVYQSSTVIVPQLVEKKEKRLVITQDPNKGIIGALNRLDRDLKNTFQPQVIIVNPGYQYQQSPQINGQFDRSNNNHRQYQNQFPSQNPYYNNNQNPRRVIPPPPEPRPFENNERYNYDRNSREDIPPPAPEPDTRQNQNPAIETRVFGDQGYRNNSNRFSPTNPSNQYNPRKTFSARGSDWEPAN
jgi:hypothetical protein